MATDNLPQGHYARALDDLQQALAIHRQTDDRPGLCATLFNLGHIYAQNNQFQEALGAWLTVYSIAREIHLAQALQSLAELAPYLGLPAGLEGWENLRQQADEAAAALPRAREGAARGAERDPPPGFVRIAWRAGGDGLRRYPG